MENYDVVHREVFDKTNTLLAKKISRERGAR